MMMSKTKDFLNQVQKLKEQNLLNSTKKYYNSEYNKKMATTDSWIHDLKAKKYKSPNLEDPYTPVTPELTKVDLVKMTDMIIEAYDKGETPEWIALKGDDFAVKTANYWMQRRKKIEEKRIEHEKALRKEELRKQALDKLSDEEREALGI